MPRIDFLVPSALDQRTGGSLYDARIVAGLRDLGWTVSVHELAGRFPDPDDRARDYGAPASVVVPGTDPAPPATGPADALLCVATLTPRKGHATLIEVLARCADLDWTLTCAGSVDRDPATAAAVRDAISSHGLDDRVTLVGELDGDALAAAYHRAGLFVLASHYEGYGMAFAEALVRGLPIVACAGGATTDTVPADAGLLVPPGDIDALASALRRVLSEPGLRERLAAGARAAALPDWPTQARVFAAALPAVAS